MFAKVPCKLHQAVSRGAWRLAALLPPVTRPCPCKLSVRTLAAAAADTRVVTASLKDQDNGALAPQPAFRAHLDYRSVRDNLQAHIDNCRQRNSGADPPRVVQLYEQFMQLQHEVERLRAARNANSGALKAKMEATARQQLVQQGKELKAELASLEAQLVVADSQLQLEAQRLPNLSHPEVPVGSEEAAKLLKEVGRPADLPFGARDHLQLAGSLDLLDLDSAAQVSGSKFYYLRNAAALLELALVNWSMQHVAARGYTPMTTPDLVRASVLERCGFQPRGTNTQVYSIQDSALCLTGTAEVPLGGVHMDRILDEAQLPIRMVAFGHCFRTEAGAAGTAGRGLYRVHQFSKVEMFCVTSPGQSAAMLDELVELEAGMYEALGLHFRVLDMPTGDLGAPAHRKVDIEAWMPGLGRYGEVSSASNCTDYQARRLNIRYRPASPSEDAGKKAATQFVHTLNGTACAVPRLLIAILETFQQADGSVLVPPVLRPYMGGLEYIR